MRQKVQAGAEFNFLTPEEHKSHLLEVVAQTAQERARGITIWRDDDDGTVDGSGNLVIPEPGNNSFDVNPGYAVLVQQIRAAGLASGDIVNVYRNVAVDKNFVAQLTYADPTDGFGSKGLILKGGEKLVITGSSMMATDVTVNAEGVEVPETDLYKLVSP